MSASRGVTACRCSGTGATAGSLLGAPARPLNVHLITVLMIAAAFSGDTVNYLIGSYIGRKAFHKDYKLLNRQNLNRSRQFYKEHGKRTIMYARFIPVIRTFAPFVAGISEMDYKTFMKYNLAGGFIWVVLYAYAGYFFGNVPFVKKHFELTVLGILVITLIPAIVAVMKAKAGKKKKQQH